MQQLGTIDSPYFSVFRQTILVLSYGVLADVVVGLHFLFVLFVGLGVAAVWKWHGLVWIHVPAVIWGIVIEVSGAICPLTWVEHWLRQRAGTDGPGSDFIAFYIFPILYPEGFTREMQLLVAALLVSVNATGYIGLYCAAIRNKCGPP